MESKEFLEFSSSVSEYITGYLDNIRDRRVLPTVEPGFLRPQLPTDAPDNPERWQDVLEDVEKIIMPGITHWHSPKFHAYFSAGMSYPAIVADMLSGAIGCIGFSWIASPSCTELEVIMMDWLGQMLGLPKEFLACSGGKGGGVIQGTASEATLMALLGSKARMVKKQKAENPELNDYDIISKLIAYASEEAHSSVERAALLGGIQIRKLPADDEFKLRGEVLQEAINKDRENGLIPFFAVGCLGTTSSCAFDPLTEIGEVCNREGVYLHIDAAYAGSSFICPENRYLMEGVEMADSFNFNPHKWLLVNFDCSAMWLKDPSVLVDAFNVDPLYLKHDQQENAPDYRHWQIPMGRRFRALKLWFVMRLFGKNNLQAHIRKHIRLAHEFEDMVRSDGRFEIVGDVLMGLVCFRLKGGNEISEKLLRTINANGNIHLVPSNGKGKYYLRLAICSRFTESEDIQASWNEVKSITDEITGVKSIADQIVDTKSIADHIDEVKSITGHIDDGKSIVGTPKGKDFPIMDYINATKKFLKVLP